MSSRTVAIWATVVLAVLTIIDVVLLRTLPASGSFWYMLIVRTAMFVLVAVAAGLAAHRFGWWSEYLGRAWTLFFVGYAFLVPSEIAKRLFSDHPLAEDVLVMTANIALIGAYWLMARSFRVAGLRYYGSTITKVAFLTLAVLLAAALVYAPVAAGIRSLTSDTPQPVQLFSAVADLITFLLVAPLLMMAFSLRGGQLSWMFGLLTAGTFGWMLNQGAGGILEQLGWETAIQSGRNFGFAMACCFIAAAALAQWIESYRGTRGTVRHG